MAYCTKTDGDYRLFDEGGRKVEESREAGFERRKVEGGGRPAGQAAPEGAALGGGAATAAGGRRPCGPYSGGLQGPAEGEIPPGIAP